MKKVLNSVAYGAFSLLLLLSSCAGPLEFWYKPNAYPGDSDRELLSCRVSGARSIPVNTQIGKTPTYVTPVITHCYPVGYYMRCSHSGGDVFGGDLYYYDVNDRLRKDVVAQCMGDKGYQSISIRQCTEKDLKKGIPSYRTLPQLNQNACVTKGISGDGYLFVNP